MPSPVDLRSIDVSQFKHWRSPCGTVLLVNADCLSVLQVLPAGCVDLLLTYPQYGISQPGVSHEGPPGKGSRSFDFFKHDSPEEASNLAMAAWRESRRLMTSSASAYWWVGHYTFGPLVAAYHGDGWKTRFLVWSKACPAPAPPGSGWPSAAELCVYAFRSGRTWTHDGTNAPRSNVITCDSYRHGIPGKVNHPTQKPFGVMVPIVEASSRIGELVLDPFIGSGTTAVCAIRTKRQCIGCEIDTEHGYFDIAVNRCRAELARQPLFKERKPREIQGSFLT